MLGTPPLMPAEALEPGASCAIVGVEARPELNGARCTLVGYSAERERWTTLGLRAANLGPVSEGGGGGEARESSASQVVYAVPRAVTFAPTPLAVPARNPRFPTRGL
ncbi:hypothetical protein T492DRAFT_890960 [Pavlovales sp. CCMP2436]|nr:hypothetical protein T492DRAFT_890960 [Pavlovales sp. CCMP2436]